MPTVRHTQIHTLISFPDYYTNDLTLFLSKCVIICSCHSTIMQWKPVNLYANCELYFSSHYMNILRLALDSSSYTAHNERECWCFQRQCIAIKLNFYSSCISPPFSYQSFCSTLQNCQALKLYNTSAEIEGQQFQDSGTLWWCVISHHIWVWVSVCLCLLCIHLDGISHYVS